MAARCVNCGATPSRGTEQLVCLECGARLGLVHRRPASWKAPLAIVVLTVAVLAVLLVLGLEAIRDRADSEVSSAAQPAVAALATAGHVPPT